MEIKIGNKKNGEVVLKSDFPNRLKKTLEVLETAAKNLKADFVACGNFYLNRQTVLQRLKKKAPNEPTAFNTINQEFIEFIKKTRKPENQQKNREVKK